MAKAKKPTLLTRAQLAERLGKSVNTISKWEQAGMPVAARYRRGVPSEFDLHEVEVWLAARQVVEQRSGVTDVAVARARKETAQAQEAEQRVLMRARDLLPREEVEQAWAAEIAAVRTKLLALPQQQADQLTRVATLDGVAGVEALLADLVRDVLRELADPQRPPTGATHAG